MSKQPLIDQLNDAISRMLADPDVRVEGLDPSIAGLLEVARDLRQLPPAGFKQQLAADLERKISGMKTIAFRTGFRTVTPYLLVPNAEFIDFLKNVFGAEETERMGPSPTMFHAEVRIGDSMLMLGVGSGQSMPAALMIHVPNADEVFKRALDAGCVELEPMKNDHGARSGTVRDTVGNSWYIASNLLAVLYNRSPQIPKDLHTITLGFSPERTEQFIDFLKRAFSAQEIGRHEWPGGMYANVRIGDSIVGVSHVTNHEWMRPTPRMVYLYVPDADGAYEQALRAGAKSIHPPTNQPYGDRNAAVEDEWGNHWYMATPV